MPSPTGIGYHWIREGLGRLPPEEEEEKPRRARRLVVREEVQRVQGWAAAAARLGRGRRARMPAPRVDMAARRMILVPCDRDVRCESVNGVEGGMSVEEDRSPKLMQRSFDVAKHDAAESGLPCTHIVTCVTG